MRRLLNSSSCIIIYINIFVQGSLRMKKETKEDHDYAGCTIISNAIRRLWLNMRETLETWSKEWKFFRRILATGCTRQTLILSADDPDSQDLIFVIRWNPTTVNGLCQWRNSRLLRILDSPLQPYLGWSFIVGCFLQNIRLGPLAAAVHRLLQRFSTSSFLQRFVCWILTYNPRINFKFSLCL